MRIAIFALALAVIAGCELPDDIDLEGPGQGEPGGEEPGDDEPIPDGPGHDEPCCGDGVCAADEDSETCAADCAQDNECEEGSCTKIRADSGGELVVTTPGPLEGIRVEIPGGVLEEDTYISVHATTIPTALPDGVLLTGPVIDLSPDRLNFSTVPVNPALPETGIGLEGLKEEMRAAPAPVRVTFPGMQTEPHAIMTYQPDINGDWNWELVEDPNVEFDEVTNTYSIRSQLRHFSIYAPVNIYNYFPQEVFECTEATFEDIRDQVDLTDCECARGQIEDLIEIWGETLSENDDNFIDYLFGLTLFRPDSCVTHADALRDAIGYGIGTEHWLPATVSTGMLKRCVTTPVAHTQVRLTPQCGSSPRFILDRYTSTSMQMIEKEIDLHSQDSGFRDDFRHYWMEYLYTVRPLDEGQFLRDWYDAYVETCEAPSATLVTVDVDIDAPSEFGEYTSMPFLEPGGVAMGNDTLNGIFAHALFGGQVFEATPEQHGEYQAYRDANPGLGLPDLPEGDFEQPDESHFRFYRIVNGGGEAGIPADSPIAMRGGNSWTTQWYGRSIPVGDILDANPDFDGAASMEFSFPVGWWYGEASLSTAVNGNTWEMTVDGFQWDIYERVNNPTTIRVAVEPAWAIAGVAAMRPEFTYDGADQTLADTDEVLGGGTIRMQDVYPPGVVLDLSGVQ